MRKTFLYVGVSTIFFASFWLATAFPTESILRAAAGSTGIAALIGALFQLFRDHAAYEKEIQLRRDDQQFHVGITSHMSDVVFDRHVKFCEEYMEEVRSTVNTLVRNHATEEAVAHANKLFNIRRNHSTWVTVSMSLQLSKFEDAIRTMGARAGFVNATTGNPQYAAQRSEAIDFVYSEFERILPQLFGKKPEDGVAVDTIEARVREMLGIEKLVELRTSLVARAHNSILSISK